MLHFVLGQNLAGRGSTKFGEAQFSLAVESIESGTNFTANSREFVLLVQLVPTPLSVDPEMDADRVPVIKIEKKLFANGCSEPKFRPRNEVGRLRESTLGRIYGYATRPESAIELIRAPMNGMTLWHRLGHLEDVAGLLIRANFANSADVPLVLAKRFGNEEFHQVKHLFNRVLTGAESNDVGIVVLASKLRG